MTDWLEHSFQIEVNIPIDRVWNIWADIEKMPQWMDWIASVKVSEDDPNLSRWTLAALGLEVNWQSRLTRVLPYQIIQWESVDGLSNRGAVRFYDRKESTIVKLTIGYGIPGVVGKLMDNLFLGRFVESTLKADLERFREYAIELGKEVED